MRLVLQRVRQASVSVDGQVLGEIGHGLVILAGVARGDTPEKAEWLANKTAHLRIFDDEQGKMNRSCLETGGKALVVSQFTLYADAVRGRRPSYIEAALPEEAAPLVEHFCQRLAAEGIEVQQGRFGAFMLVELSNDGPVTIILEK